MLAAAANNSKREYRLDSRKEFLIWDAWNAEHIPQAGLKELLLYKKK
jgi:hypothetical protein